MILGILKLGSFVIKSCPPIVRISTDFRQRIATEDTENSEILGQKITTECTEIHGKRMGFGLAFGPGDGGGSRSHIKLSNTIFYRSFALAQDDLRSFWVLYHKLDIYQTKNNFLTQIYTD